MVPDVAIIHNPHSNSLSLQMLTLLTSLASVLAVSRAEEVCRPRPLGLMDRSIRDWQLAAR